MEIDIDTLALPTTASPDGACQATQRYRAALKQSCSAVGASVQGDRGAREKAAQSILAFLRKVFPR